MKINQICIIKVNSCATKAKVCHTHAVMSLKLCNGISIVSKCFLFDWLLWDIIKITYFRYFARILGIASARPKLRLSPVTKGVIASWC